MGKQGDGLNSKVVQESDADLGQGNLPDREKWSTANKDLSNAEVKKGQKLFLTQVTAEAVEIAVRRSEDKVTGAMVLFKEPGEYLIQINKQLAVGRTDESVKIFEEDLVQLNVVKPNTKITLSLQNPAESGEGSLAIYKFENKLSRDITLRSAVSHTKIGIDDKSAINFMWNRDGSAAVMSGDHERGFRVTSFTPRKLS